VIYRFSGSFRKAAPLMLTERVLGRDGSVLTLEVVLDDGTTKETLHLRKETTAGSAEEVLDVTRLEAGVEHAATASVYEAMMAKTILTADENEERLGTEAATVMVGKSALPCRKTTYRVRVGKREATMSTVESDAFLWGDVGGEITTPDGQVLYRVEVVDAAQRADGR
jgi:hypothetical protein